MKNASSNTVSGQTYLSIFSQNDPQFVFWFKVQQSTCRIDEYYAYIVGPLNLSYSWMSRKLKEWTPTIFPSVKKQMSFLGQTRNRNTFNTYRPQFLDG